MHTIFGILFFPGFSGQQGSIRNPALEDLIRAYGLVRCDVGLPGGDVINALAGGCAGSHEREECEDV